ncbi:hypothetical protein XENOCAPTIV_020555 [Xenoophorus captivus]|uniref:Uncharacterized protein n=1 Tax=Xenoophorus captivus TaxID=1517983 RepID=A0ABV0RCY2_9TELE
MNIHAVKLQLCFYTTRRSICPPSHSALSCFLFRSLLGETEGFGVGVSSFFYPQCGVEAVPAPRIDTLHITGFGLSSPLSCAELLQDWLWPPLLPGSVISFAHRSALRTDSVSISKPAANLPTLADTHSSQSRQDRRNTYGGKEKERSESRSNNFYTFLSPLLLFLVLFLQ